MKHPKFFFGACIFSIFINTRETWTLNKAAEKRSNAFEHKCYRRVLKISWTEKRTNKSMLQELPIYEGRRAENEICSGYHRRIVNECIGCETSCL
jgi:hypothetical protein